MSIYFDDPDVRLHLGDALEVLSSMETGACDAALALTLQNEIKDE